MNKENLVKLGDIMDIIANRETKIGNKLREIALEKEMSLEDKKKIHHFRKYYRKLAKIIIEIEQDKMLLRNEKGKLVGRQLGGAKGYCESQIKFIKKKYEEEEENT